MDIDADAQGGSVRTHLLLVLSYVAGAPALAVTAVSPFARLAVEARTVTGFVAPGLQLQCLLRRNHHVPPDATGLSSSSDDESDEGEEGAEEDERRNDGAAPPPPRRVRKQWRTHQLSPGAHGAYMFAWSYVRRQASCKRGVRAGGLAAPPALKLVPGLLGREGRAGQGVVSRQAPHAQLVMPHLERFHVASEARTGMYTVHGRSPALPPGAAPRSASSRGLDDGSWMDVNEAAASLPLRVLYVTPTPTAPPGVDNDRRERVWVSQALLAALWWLARPLTTSPSTATTTGADPHISAVLPLFLLVEHEAHDRVGRARHASTAVEDSRVGDDATHAAGLLGAVLFPTCRGPLTEGEASCPHTPSCAALLTEWNTRAAPPSTCDARPPCGITREGLCAFRRVVRVAACDVTRAPSALALSLLHAATAFTGAAFSDLACNGGWDDSQPRRSPPYALEELRLSSPSTCAWLTSTQSGQVSIGGEPPRAPRPHGTWGPTVLSHLRVLDVSHCITLTDVKWLQLSSSVSGSSTVSSSPRTTVVGSAAPWLQVLDVSYCTAITDLSPLRHLPQLRILRASGLPGLSSMAWLMDSAKDALSSAGEGVRTGLGGCGGEGGGLALEELALADCGALVCLYPLGVLRHLRRLTLSTSFDIPPAHVLPVDSLDSVHEKDSDDRRAVEHFRRLPAPRHEAAIDALRGGEDDLSWIQHCGLLITLGLRGRAHLRNVSAIGTLGHLEQLDLTGCAYVRSLDWITSCVALTSVKLCSCVRITDWTPLRQLPRVVSLDVGTGGHRALEAATRAQRTADQHAREQLASVSPGVVPAPTHRLAWVKGGGDGAVRWPGGRRGGTARGLRVLNLSYLEDGIGNFAIDQALRRLPRIRVLDLRGCQQLQTLTWAFQLPRVRELVLFDCPAIKDLTALGAMVSLERLFLSDAAKVEAVPWIASCTHLCEVFLVNLTALNDIRAFAALPRLRTLTITHSSLSDIRWLREPPVPPQMVHFPALLVLDLSYATQLKDIQALGVIRQLRLLRLTSCTALHTLGPPLPALGAIAAQSRGGDHGHYHHHPSRRAQRTGSPSGSPPSSPTHSVRTWLDIKQVVWPARYAQPRRTDERVTATVWAQRVRDLKATADSPVAEVGLGGCIGLEEVDVARCSALCDVAPLARLPLLRRLRADQTAVKSLRWLPVCRTLTHLDLTGTPLMKRGAAHAGTGTHGVETLTPAHLLWSELASDTTTLRTEDVEAAQCGTSSAAASTVDPVYQEMLPPDLVWWNGMSLRQV